jgi:Type II secretion system (T2SS), protein E, N-terminal domain
MGTASLTFDSWSLIWRRLSARLLPDCGRPDCVRARSLWRRLRLRHGVLLQGARYCPDQCLEHALREALRRTQPPRKRSPGNHRVPLGLLLLSRQQLTAEQLRQALEAQHAAGRGRIGEWLQDMGFASDVEITAALARQWACPVLHAGSFPLDPASARIPQLPLSLLEAFAMAPVDYIPATATLHMAFGEGIDYTVLYAIEQMLGCHTEPCLVLPSLLRRTLAGRCELRRESELVFDRVADTAELARMIRSYAVCAAATEIRLAACGSHLWVRLLRAARHPLDMLLRGASQTAPVASAGLRSGAPPGL